MLSIAKLRLAAEDYFLATVAKGTEEYYSEHGDAPVNGSRRATRCSASRARSPATSSAPCSQAPTHSAASRSARRAGRFRASTCASRRPSQSRCSSRSVIHRSDRASSRRTTPPSPPRSTTSNARRPESDGDTPARAAFAPTDSSPPPSGIARARAVDPQLHTHVLVANSARGIDGRWSALDGHLLYRYAKTAGYLYQAHLRYELTRQLGVHWGAVVSGSAELEGVPAP